jgi:hypothetical protein
MNVTGAPMNPPQRTTGRAEEPYPERDNNLTNALEELSRSRRLRLTRAPSRS